MAEAAGAEARSITKLAGQIFKCAAPFALIKLSWLGARYLFMLATWALLGVWYLTGSGRKLRIRSMSDLFVGRGSDAARLQSIAVQQQLENVLFFDEVDPDNRPLSNAMSVL